MPAISLLGPVILVIAQHGSNVYLPIELANLKSGEDP